MAASDYVPIFFKNRLHLLGRPQMGSRPSRRDQVATAMEMGCPIWTEDTDFFGCGVATWTTDRVEFYLAETKVETAFER